jgi:glycosyltransferase involved in cell wall biosynthesis
LFTKYATINGKTGSRKHGPIGFGNQKKVKLRDWDSQIKKLMIIVNVDWFFLSHRKEIATVARQSGYDVTIIAKDTGRKTEIQKMGFRFFDMPMSRTTQNPLSDLNTIWFLHKIYKQEKPDIIHHVGLKVILIGGLIAKLTNNYNVINAISGLGVTFAAGRNNLQKAVLIPLLKTCHHTNSVKVIFQNDDDRKIFKLYNIISNHQAVFIKGSGVDLRTIVYTPEPPSGKIKIIFSARMLIEKGVLILVEAALLLKEQYRERIQFILCGGLDENPLALTKSQLMELTDGDYILWLGHRSDITDLLKSSHIAVLPSYYREGLPKSLIEAAASGRPIITTDSVGCRDAVIDGYNGYTIPIKNSLILAQKLEVLIEKPEIRKVFGINSRKYAEKYFSLENVLNEHLKLYSKLSADN